MKNLSAYIVELLYKHECVIIPDFGAFIARNEESRYDKRRGLMLPPRRRVYFNASITHTDGLLADYIAEKENISYDEATNYIAKSVDDIRDHTSRGGVYTLDGLGQVRTVQIGSTEQIEFLLDDDANFMPESYGLTAVRVEERRKSLSEQVDRVGLRRAVASAAAVALLLLMSTRTNDPAGVERADLSSVFAQMQATSKTSSQHTETAQEDTTNTHIATTTHDKEIKESFYVVVASFKSHSEATEYTAKQKVRGITDLDIIDSGNGKYRVVAAHFNSQEDAVVANRDIKNIKGFEKSWVLRVVE